MEEEKQKTKVKVLKERTITLEKQLFSAFKELDHYRNKCKKLRLLLLKERAKGLGSESSKSSAPQTPAESIILSSPVQNPSKIPVSITSISSPSVPKTSIPFTPINTIPDLPKKRENSIDLQISFKKPKLPFEVEEGEEGEISDSKKPPLKKVAVSKPDKKIVPIKKIEPKPEPIQKILPDPKVLPNKIVNKRPAAYNQPYTLDPPQSLNKIPLNSLIPVKPCTVPQQNIPQTIKETFEIVRKLYQSDYEFNVNNVFLLSEVLKSADSASAGSFLVTELIESIFIFSASDALALVYGILQDLLITPNYNKDFLKSIRNYFIHSAQDLWFNGKVNKLTSMNILVNTVQEVLHASFVLICKQNSLIWMVCKMLVKVMVLKNFKLFRGTYAIIAEEYSGVFAARILFRAVIREENLIGILKEMNELSGNCDEDMKKSIYLCCKGILRYLGAKDSYEAYRNVFWPNLKQKKNSFYRVLFIKVIAVLYLILEKEGRFKICTELKEQLNEIVGDKENKSFTQQEKVVVSEALKKIGRNSHP